MITELGEPGLSGLHLELALAHVVEILRGPHDHVDDGPDEGEEGRHGRAADEHRIGDPPASVRVRPVHERQPDHDQEDNQQVHSGIDAAVADAENGKRVHCQRRV